uniref:Protein kinase domain-containing protein n=1 Tax=Setaria viridis TaxID=4556 RepID=A0A4V6D3T6_SETVI|nr:hypothetical protein SEVIR_7G067800v2 [Setaria viridis]
MVTSFCEKHNVKVVDMNGKYIPMQRSKQFYRGICTAVFSGLIIFLAVEWIRHKQTIPKQDLIRVIGEGGQGTVFKGYNIDSDNNPVAIKRCKNLDQDRIQEFGQELLILSGVTHKNIVEPLCCSLHFEAPVLTIKASIRTLEIRLRIAAQAAEAIAYLHTLSHPIFHGHVKPANILLDHNLSPKVSDFGCSMIRSAEENLQAVKGTMGYIGPEYLLNFEFTDKSDDATISKQKESLVSVFKEAAKEGKLLELVDREIAEQDNMVLCQVASLADKCLAMTGASRPTMSQVAQELRQLLISPEIHGTGELLAGSPFTVQAGLSSNASYDCTSEATTDYYSPTKEAAMSIEFAR